MSEKQICQICKTGKLTYELDPKSEFCPYIEYWNDNKCPFYKPLDKPSNKHLEQLEKQHLTYFYKRF